MRTQKVSNSLMRNGVSEALSRIHAIMEQKGSHILHTNDIERRDRELLVRNHWLQEIIQGWYLVVRPDVLPGDSTAWYANFWDFLRIYLQHYYGQEYCLSAECSIDLHIGSLVIPKQVIVMAKKGRGVPLELLFGTSLLVYATKNLPEQREEKRGLQVMSLAYALCKVTPFYFETTPQDAEIALRSVTDFSELFHVIERHQFKNGAERLVGAYRFLGNDAVAEELKNGLKNIGLSITEKNPFIKDGPILPKKRYASPYAARIFALWKQFRQVVIDNFPAPPGLPKNIPLYLQQVAEIYVKDAYNSLSIEGYKVNKELIERVKNGIWQSEQNHGESKERNALAALGYYRAFLTVKDSIEQILGGSSAATVAQRDLPKWYQNLFYPSVEAQIISPSELMGYRRHQVYIRASRHMPPAKDYLLDTMEAFFQCLQEEDHPGVRAILGRFLFVYIHPYMDGNGRTGRFLMNAMLASGGYPWTIIQVVHRNHYFTALESASVDANILPFTQFVASEMLNKPAENVAAFLKSHLNE